MARAHAYRDNLRSPAGQEDSSFPFFFSFPDTSRWLLRVHPSPNAPLLLLWVKRGRRKLRGNYAIYSVIEIAGAFFWKTAGDDDPALLPFYFGAFINCAVGRQARGLWALMAEHFYAALRASRALDLDFAPFLSDVYYCTLVAKSASVGLY